MERAFESVGHCAKFVRIQMLDIAFVLVTAMRHAGGGVPLAYI